MAEDSAEPACARAHYGIQYHLRVEKGVVTPSSKLWMGALLFTKDLPDEQLPEWLSQEPLEVVPDGFTRPASPDVD